MIAINFPINEYLNLILNRRTEAKGEEKCEKVIYWKIDVKNY